jgi:hypothetical protein
MADGVCRICGYPGPQHVVPIACYRAIRALGLAPRERLVLQVAFLERLVALVAAGAFVEHDDGRLTFRHSLDS